jgi:hypothetical protein
MSKRCDECGRYRDQKHTFWCRAQYAPAPAEERERARRAEEPPPGGGPRIRWHRVDGTLSPTHSVEEAGRKALFDHWKVATWGGIPIPGQQADFVVTGIKWLPRNRG